MYNLYRLGKQDINASADIIAKAFCDYPMFQHILADKLNHENIRLFLNFLIKYSILYAEHMQVQERWKASYYLQILKTISLI